MGRGRDDEVMIDITDEKEMMRPFSMENMTNFLLEKICAGSGDLCMGCGVPTLSFCVRRCHFLCGHDK